MSRDSLNDANPPSRRRWVGTEPPKRDDTDDLVSRYPTHIPMSLPLPTVDPDRPDEQYSL